MARKIDGEHKSIPSYNNQVINLVPVGPAVDAPLLSDLDAETVLCGPGGDPDRIVIDDLMAKTWQDTLSNLCDHFEIPPHQGKRLRSSIDTPLWVWTQKLRYEGEIIGHQDDGYGFLMALPDDKGIAHITGDDMDGFRLDGLLLECDLCVDPLARGFGIGSMIIATALLKFGELPTWHHDKPGYSHAGAGAVQSGLSLAKTLCEKQNDCEVSP